MTPTPDARPSTRYNPQLREILIDPLEAAGRLRLLDGDTPLRTGHTVATPGHTPGHPLTEPFISV